jgi:hypothetical protein
MRFGRSSWNWYDIPIIGLAAVMVYPDKCLHWLGERTGRDFGWRHVALLEFIAIGSTIAFMTLLSSADANLRWGKPVMAAGALATVRAIHWAVARATGLDD